MRDIRVPASQEKVTTTTTETDVAAPRSAATRPVSTADTTTLPAGERRPNRSWRVVDIVTAAVLAVAGGLIFWGWNAAYAVPAGAMDAALPGAGGIVAGMWMLPAILGALIIRKPGAAFFVELLAAVVSMALGAKWGWGTALSGAVQGLGAELVFLAFRYRRFTLPVAMLAGAAAGLFEFVNELFTYGILQQKPAYQLTYAITMILSGAVLAGLLGWLLTKALAATGALDRFAAGREARAVDVD